MTKSTHDPFRGKMATSSRINERIEHIVYFDKRLQHAIVAHDVAGLQGLAAWADEKGLRISRKAREAAQELEPT